MNETSTTSTIANDSNSSSQRESSSSLPTSKPIINEGLKTLLEVDQAFLEEPLLALTPTPLSQMSEEEIRLRIARWDNRRRVVQTLKAEAVAEAEEENAKGEVKKRQVKADKFLDEYV